MQMNFVGIRTALFFLLHFFYKLQLRVFVAEDSAIISLKFLLQSKIFTQAILVVLCKFLFWKKKTSDYAAILTK